MTKKTSQLQIKIKKKWEKLDIQISKDLRDTIHGYMMSEGYIKPKLGVLQVEQGKKQKSYIQWLYQKMAIIRTSYPIQEVNRTRGNTTTKSLRFYTRNCLHGFRHMWYEENPCEKGKYQKKLPITIECFFNETFVSVWFAGDGTKILGSRGAKFEVTAFSVQDRKKLQNLFWTKFEIKTVIISSGKSINGTPQWALKIPANEYTKFRNLITKQTLIPTLFPHKLHKK